LAQFRDAYLYKVKMKGFKSRKPNHAFLRQDVGCFLVA